MSRKILLSVGGLAIALGAAAVIWAQPRIGGSVESLKIGAVVADPPSSLGDVSQAVREGFALAVRDLNAEWKDAPRVELVVLDSGGSASTANERLRELKRAGVAAVAEVVGSEVLAGCVATIREEKIVVTSAVNSDPKLGGAFGPYFFRAAPSETNLGRELAVWCREVRAKKPVLVCTEGERAAQLRSGFAQSWASLGIAPSIEVASGQVTAQRVREKLAALAPDWVILNTSPKDTLDVLRDAGQSLPAAHFMAAPPALTADDLKSAGTAVNRLVALELKAGAAPARRAAIAADERVLAAYDTLQTLARAARGTKGDTDALITRLRTIDYDGTTGRLAFDENGERRSPAVQRRSFTDLGVAVPFSLNDFTAAESTNSK